MKRSRLWFIAVFTMMGIALLATPLFAQLDQGTITGVVQDPSGAVIAHAAVTLTSVDQGFVVKATTDGAGIYTFPSVKIGNYSITASASGFQTTTQTNLHLNIQQRLNVVVTLKPGAVTETVTVTTQAPILQSQDSSVGQTMSAQTINSVPLNGRNWVYIAQLAAGAAPPTGSRGASKGDFNANGQRAEENNFILDGVDNNANVVDFYNGASYVVNPPPDALAEFKLQTSNYSAEFGHSAGAVVNASIKSGTNSFHGSLWEYVRNNALGEATTPEWAGGNGKVPPYHQNIFGATLGGPFLKNKLFFFADVQANRVVFNSPQTFSVPSLLERTGDFSELLAQNGALIGQAGTPVQLYTQDPTGVNPPTPIPNNCMAATCASGTGAGLPLNQYALHVLNEYPKPGGNANAAAGLIYNNYSAVYPVIDNTFQWDARMDWTISSNDSAYSRYSYYNEVGENWGSVPVLGPILDGGGFGDGNNKNYGANYMVSETHIFTPTLLNEARFGFNYLHTGFQQPNAANAGLAASQGFGGIPAGPLNGGLPNSYFDGPASPHGFGAPTWAATDEHENVYQILDNVSKVEGSQSLKAGVNYQNIRFSTLQPQEPRGVYDFNNRGTADPSNLGSTGYGVADFLLDQIKWAQLSNEVTNGDQRGYFAAYVQDDWRVRRNLTINVGLRYDYFQPYQDVGGYQASFYFTSKPSIDTTTGIPSVTGNYVIPAEAKSYASPIISQYGFDTALAQDGLKIVYDSNPRLQTTQNLNFAPRLGIAWSPDPKTVVRAGYGIFYGGIESLGYWGNLGENYPFQFTAGWDSPSCGENYCQQPSTIPGQNITIENGFSTILSNGFASVVTNLSLRGTDAAAKTSYTEGWNLSLERSIMRDMTGTISYVGNASHHLIMNIDANAPLALVNPGSSTQAVRPMPDYGGSAYTGFEGMSDYHSLQTKLEKRMSRGFNLLATYTWSHALDTTPTPLGSSGDNSNIRQTNLIPFKYDYSNSPWDIRHRFTFNALWELPVGRGRAYLNNDNKIVDALAGGWSVNPTFVAQTGEHFTIGTSGISTAAGFGSGPNAYQVADEFQAGGSGGNCASKVKTRAHWFNPCSYANPWDAGDKTINGAPNPHYIPRSAADTPAGDSTPVYVTDLASVLGYAGGRRNIAAGPGYERVNMSVFKDFSVFRENREQRLTFRADIFNLFNTPSWGTPAGNNSSSGGQITSTRSIQQYSPDARFFQLSLKYAF